MNKEYIVAGVYYFPTYKMALEMAEYLYNVDGIIVSIEEVK